MTTLNETDVRELQWVADVLNAAADGDQPTQGYEQAARDLAGVIESKLPRPVEPVQAGDLFRVADGARFIALVVDGQEGYAFLEGYSKGRFHHVSFADLAKGNYQRVSL